MPPLYSWNIFIGLDALSSLTNKWGPPPPPASTPENYSKILGISKKEQNNSFQVVSCFIYQGLRISFHLMSTLK